MSGYTWRGTPDLTALNAGIMAARPQPRPDIDRERSRTVMRRHPWTQPPAPSRAHDSETLAMLEAAGLIRWLPGAPAEPGRAA